MTWYTQRNKIIKSALIFTTYVGPVVFLFLVFLSAQLAEFWFSFVFSYPIMQCGIANLVSLPKWMFVSFRSNIFRRHDTSFFEESAVFFPSFLRPGFSFVLSTKFLSKPCVFCAARLRTIFAIPFFNTSRIRAKVFSALQALFYEDGGQRKTILLKILKTGVL